MKLTLGCVKLIAHANQDTYVRHSPESFAHSPKKAQRSSQCGHVVEAQHIITIDHEGQVGTGTMGQPDLQRSTLSYEGSRASPNSATCWGITHPTLWNTDSNHSRHCLPDQVLLNRLHQLQWSHGMLRSRLLWQAC